MVVCMCGVVEYYIETSHTLTTVSARHAKAKHAVENVCRVGRKITVCSINFIMIITECCTE